MVRIVADLGNSRLKWARLGSDRRLEQTVAVPVDDEDAWSAAWHRWDLSGAGSSWAISTVNPPIADRFGSFLKGMGASGLRWYTSAADVPVRHVLEEPGSTGTDRAFAVLAATAMQPAGTPGLVVSCGSAVVVERVSAAGVWEGGAIAPGMGMSSRALHLLTAQLPLVSVASAPPAWGSATSPAIAAGLFWGTVGAIRELVARQSAGLEPAPWVVWTGGEAPLFTSWISGAEALIVPDLVLLGLAQTALDQDDGRPEP
ncbi:MAG TPA: type III pantothenate kinase [Isosphaeraceae bacterium]|nr:type III pantothenate kinase [Isosphaeraceae bacterium]